MGWLRGRRGKSDMEGEEEARGCWGGFGGCGGGVGGCGGGVGRGFWGVGMAEVESREGVGD